MSIFTSQVGCEYHNNNHTAGDGYYARRNPSGIPMRKVQSQMGAAHYKVAKDLSEVQKPLLEHATSAGSCVAQEEGITSG